MSLTTLLGTGPVGDTGKGSEAAQGDGEKITGTGKSGTGGTCPSFQSHFPSRIGQPLVYAGGKKEKGRPPAGPLVQSGRRWPGGRSDRRAATKTGQLRILPSLHPPRSGGCSHQVITGKQPVLKQTAQEAGASDNHSLPQGGEEISEEWKNSSQA